MYRLENWSVAVVEGDYRHTPPECIPFCLQGEVYNHPRFTDGDFVVTSPMLYVDKNIITTQKGSKYQLGRPNKNYIEWCKQNNTHIPTPEEPIKIRK